MYLFKILNKEIYALCFLNVFIENMCLYMMPIVLSIYLTLPFDVSKLKKLIILSYEHYRIEQNKKTIRYCS